MEVYLISKVMQYDYQEINFECTYTVLLGAVKSEAAAKNFLRENFTQKMDAKGNIYFTDDSDRYLLTVDYYRVSFID